MQEAIKLAVKSGYDVEILPKPQIFIDPLFWKCLGKSLAWEDENINQTYWVKENGLSIIILDRWENEMHNFIDHLINNNNIDDFFNNIIK